VFAAVLALIGLALVAAAVSITRGWGTFLVAHHGPGSFYEIVSFPLMLVPALLAGLYIVGVLTGSCIALWRDACRLRPRGVGLAWAYAVGDVAGFRFSKGGGGGCYYLHSNAPSAVRRRLHAAVFWGFGATFVSTLLAAFWQDLLGVEPPFAVLSPPVLVGTLGGALLVVGASGLLLLKARSSPALADGAMTALDFVFLLLLDLASATGMLTLVVREMPALGPILALHLAILVALFATAPYGKFVHGAYRFAALLLNRAEARMEA
jgi:citrate/tricarballylate utilization protein